MLSESFSVCLGASSGCAFYVGLRIVMNRPPLLREDSAAKLFLSLNEPPLEKPEREEPPFPPGSTRPLSDLLLDSLSKGLLGVLCIGSNNSASLTEAI